MQYHLQLAERGSNWRYGLLVLALTGWPAIAGALSLTVIPSTTTTDFGGALTLEVGGLTEGQSVVIQKYADTDANGQVDQGEPLVESFVVTDGQATEINGVRNPNVPSDQDGSVNSHVRVLINGPFSWTSRIAGSYLFRAVIATNPATAVVSPLTVTVANQTQSISGQVVSSGSPVANAWILAMSTELQGKWIAGTTADGQGNYRLRLPAGQYQMLACKPGFVADRKQAPLVTLDSSQDWVTNLNLTAATRAIRGILRDASTHAGLAGVPIWLTDLNAQTVLAISDASGEFVAPVLEGSWRLSLEETTLALLGYAAPGDNAIAPVDTLVGDQAGVLMDLPRATALIHGSVKDNFNRSVSGMAIRGQTADHAFGAFTLSDPLGAYVLAVVGGQWQTGPASDYLLTRGYLGMEPVQINVNPGETPRHDFMVVRSSTHLRGLTQDSSSLPMAGVKLILSDHAGLFTTTRSGADGRFDGAVAGGQWFLQLDPVEAAQSGLNANEIELQVIEGEDQDNVVVTIFQAVAQVQGQVVDNTGAPVVQVQILARDSSGKVYSQATETNGGFAFVLTAGSWVIELDSRDAANANLISPVLSLTVANSQQPINLLVVAQRSTADVFGWIRDKQTNGLPEIPVSALSSLGSTNYRAATITQVDGSYILPVFDGSWELGLSAAHLNQKGFQAVEPQVVAINGADQVVNFVASRLIPQVDPFYLQSAGISSSGQFLLLFTGQPGYTYEIQGTTNLVTWETVTTFLHDGPTRLINDVKTLSYRNRSYRAMLVVLP